MADLPGYISDTELYYDEDGITGSFVAGVTGTVTATRAALFSLDGAVNTNDTPGLFKIAGDLEVTGTTTLDGSAAVVALDDLSDVVITTPAATQLLEYSGSTWANAYPLVRRATVNLTDAQVKALPTTPVTVVAAPASGYRIRPIQVSYSAAFSGGVYTNLNATYIDVHLKIGSDYVGYGPVTDSTVTPTITQATDIFGSTGSHMYDQGLPPQLGNPGGYVQTSGVYTRSQQEATAMQIGIDNNGSGNFTGGNAGNTFRVTVYYVVEPF